MVYSIYLDETLSSSIASAEDAKGKLILFYFDLYGTSTGKVRTIDV
jgi:hypothetical protein